MSSTSSSRSDADNNRNKMASPAQPDWVFVGEEQFEKASITFSGCGFLGIYHIGVISCLKQHAPKYLEHFSNFGGASAGALSSCTLMFNMDLESCVQFVMKLAGKARNSMFGPLSQDFDPVGIVRRTFLRFLPENAHEIATGKLHISMTRVSDWENVVVSDYNSKQELVDALICTSFVPFYSGVKPPKFRGVAYVDGGFTDNLPQHFAGTTITVSPFSGESDICPDDANGTWFHLDMRNTSVQFTSQNLYRMSRAFFPPSQEVLCDMCRQGFKDALKYLHLHYPVMLNIGITRVKIPNCCNECQDSEEDDGSVCSCSTAETMSDPESTISAEGLAILHHVAPEALNEILHRAKDVISETDLIMWHLVKVFLRIAKWLARPCIYTVQHLVLFAREVAQWLIPKVQEISQKNYYTKTVVNLALEIFNTYKDRYQCERHPSLRDEDFTDMAEATARLKAVQAHMRVVPINESQSRARISVSQSMCNIPRRKSSLQVQPTTPTKSMPTPRKLSDSSCGTSRSVTPPNMGYLGLSPQTDLHSRTPISRKSLELLLEAGEFRQPERIFKVGSCKNFKRIDELRYDVADSLDEFVNDFVFVDSDCHDDSDCDFH